MLFYFPIIFDKTTGFGHIKAVLCYVINMRWWTIFRCLW